MSFPILDMIRTLDDTLRMIVQTDRDPKVIVAAKSLAHRLSVVAIMVRHDMEEAVATKMPMDVEAMRLLGAIRGQVMLLDATKR